MKRFALVCLAAAGCIVLSQQQAPAFFKLNVSAGANVGIAWGPPYFCWNNHGQVPEPNWMTEPFPYYNGGGFGGHAAPPPVIDPGYHSYAPSYTEPPLAAPADPKPLPKPAAVENTAYWTNQAQPVNSYNYGYNPYNYAPYGYGSYGYYGYGYNAPSYWYGN